MNITIKLANEKMSQETTTFNSSILTILFVIFLVLKLTGNIDWSWWWVTSPLWIPLVLLFTTIIGVMMFYRGNK
jgi:hypothetical protein